MTDLVLLHHNEPMTTSLAIAEGTENTHKAVIQLARKYVEDLQNFGRVAFEMEPFATEGGNQWREVAYLNEPQATLLITYLRNTDIVRRFKIALVKAFYELRDRLRGTSPQFFTANLAHGADLAVAADRTFRGYLRSARAAGLRLPQALRIANRQTQARTGMDMLAELGVDPAALEPPPAPEAPPDPLAEALAEWVAGAEDGRYYELAEILMAVAGVGRPSKQFDRLAPRAGRFLRALGFENHYVRDGGPLRRKWIRAGQTAALEATGERFPG